MTAGIVFGFLSLCVVGLYVYKNYLIQEKPINQIDIESEQNTAAEKIVEETLTEVEKIE